ncbi:MAG: GDP-mannose 4,6-dehydratase [Nanoarchaeota archaeon]|nr:GDP-mannose 4,6-dehydratase [Nanoarchaeota archaeon]
MKRVLITGTTGFVGSHLAELLLNKGFEVHGIERPRSKNENILHIKDKLKIHEADIRDATSIQRLIKIVEPEYIFHLAAQSFVHTSFNSPEETLTTNIIGNLNILESVRQLNIDPVIQIACSSEEYGLVKEDEVPIKETNPLRPLSPYGVSKVAQDTLSVQYNRSYGLKTVITRAFNHTGPRRGEVFATSNFAKQIAEIEKGKKEPIIYVGNLDAKRDFTDVRDMVKAYLLAVEKCDYGEAYNICSGKTWKISEMLDILLKMSEKKIEIKQDVSRLRPSDVMILQGDCTKFEEKTGWRPEIPFETTMKDLLDYWRERV